jgi:hypothetical protein
MTKVGIKLTHGVANLTCKGSASVAAQVDRWGGSDVRLQHQKPAEHQFSPFYDGLLVSADAAGFDKAGYNKEGFDKTGFNK